MLQHGASTTVHVNLYMLQRVNKQNCLLVTKWGANFGYIPFFVENI